ncbi:glycine betaine ABC transporter substrate-binding protein [Bacillus sp. DX1.1]|uniref:glycine betaine ABC transporter substrate-binding protein n=1 Tax=unclassified Bacillus (in: firmicutes) TaxID=185979 RepID=UPI00256FB164|nr:MULTISPECIES: glycine betaine ABC transporter substrate-binding protein [unclassified Bacillus (in: firmicutes)]MDM5154460.1 glycine betaine ABC transporter substrate-binding protein [Bacillus sp. DX1.1]WJE83363.1 glycine betaine ABC transporter substrate-binding protein [Bacillus sp. DX3.1]
MKKKIWFICILFLISIISSSCSTTKDTTKGKIKLGVTSWKENIATANMWKVLLEQKGYKVELMYLEKAAVWTGLARGDVDANLEVWLPVTDKPLYEKYKDDVVIKSKWYEGTGLGLIVPSYMTNINSIEDLNAHKDEFNNKIIGIEPGSSLMRLTDKAIKEYGIELNLIQSSEAAMMSELKRAYSQKKPIAVTLWNPHWAFSEFDLKYLKDPKKVYGEKDDIYYSVRKGFEKDYPELIKYFDKWKMTDKQLGTLMVMLNKTKDPEQAAKEWIKQNKKVVDTWMND